jgi:pilus assembly protein CpaC
MAFSSPAQAQNALPVSLNQLQQGVEITIPVNKSHILEVDQAIDQVNVGNPAIADVVPLTTQSIYILGQSIGTTNLTLTDADNNVIAVIDIAVTYDLNGLQSRLAELVPDEDIQIVPANGALILNGTVSSQATLTRALAVANHYAPGNVTNLLSVEGSQQVLLKVRFAEVQRSALRDVGANLETLIFSNDDIFTLFSGNGINPAAFGLFGGAVTSGDVQTDLFIDALEQRGFVRTIAEPNIIALSGDTANLLAGGEFPIPIAQSTEGDNQTITVQFKQFGVGLGFTPTVIGRETINLVLTTEVSAIDESLRVTAGGVSVPGLSVRRTNTTVELLDGQSFAISGLTQDNFSDAIDSFPILGELPILGTLFRSPDFRRQQTELVVIVTAHLVQPVDGEFLSSPTDSQNPPTDHELFLEGRVDAPDAPVQDPGGFVLP